MEKSSFGGAVACGESAPVGMCLVGTNITIIIAPRTSRGKDAANQVSQQSCDRRSGFCRLGGWVHADRSELVGLDMVPGFVQRKRETAAQDNEADRAKEDELKRGRVDQPPDRRRQ